MFLDKVIRHGSILKHIQMGCVAGWCILAILASTNQKGIKIDFFHGWMEFFENFDQCFFVETVFGGTLLCGFSPIIRDGWFEFDGLETKSCFGIVQRTNSRVLQHNIPRSQVHALTSDSLYLLPHFERFLKRWHSYQNQTINTLMCVMEYVVSYENPCKTLP